MNNYDERPNKQPNAPGYSDSGPFKDGGLPETPTCGLTEDATFELYRAAKAEGRDGHEFLAPLYRLLRGHVGKVIYLTMHEHAPEMADTVANLILAKLDTFKGNSKFSTWVHAFVRNQCLTEIARRKREVSYEALELDSVTEAVVESPYQRVLIHELLEDLTDEEKNLVVAQLHGETSAEIAEQLGITDVGVRKRTFTLMKKLRERYGAEEVLEPISSGV